MRKEVKNRLEAGAYTMSEAAHYLHIPVSTLRAWALGQRYVSSAGARRFKPVIQVSDQEDRLLSFNNLVELHILAGIRKVHNIPLPRIREGLTYVERTLKVERPLLTKRFMTDGLDLFVEHSGLLVNVSRDGQIPFRTIIDRYLQRIERDETGAPIKLYPFTRHAGQEDEKKIVIDPAVAFGRPVVAGTGIPTANIFERFLAGEPVEELADDFSVDSSLVEEAIRCEQIASAAA